MAIPEMGVKYTFDDLEATQGIKRMNDMLRQLETTSNKTASSVDAVDDKIEKMIQSLQIGNTPVRQAVEVYDELREQLEEQVEAIDQMIGAYYGVAEPIKLLSSTTEGAILRFGQMHSMTEAGRRSLLEHNRAIKEAAEQEKAHEEAMKNLVATMRNKRTQAQHLKERMDEWTRVPVEKVKDKVDDLSKANEKLGRSVKDQAAEEESRYDSVSKGLRKWRWELVTLIFFINRVSRAVRSMWTLMSEAEEEQAQRAGLRALAETYRRNADVIVQSLKEVSITHLSTMEAVEVAQRGMLQDQGRFAESYGQLWVAAQRTAAAAGEEAVDHFSAFLEALVTGDAKVLDSASNLFHAEAAVKKYADSAGIAAKDVDDLSRSNTIYNEIMTTSNRLQAAGIDEDLKRADSIGEVKRSWAELKSEVGLATKALLEAGGAFDDIVKGLDEATPKIREAIAIFAFLREITPRTPATPWGKSTWDMEVDPLSAAQRAYDRVMGAGEARMEGEGRGLGPGLEEYPDLVKESTDRATTTIADHLLKRQELIDNNLKRIEKIHADHAIRLEDMEIRHQLRLDKIQRDYILNQARELRKYQRRISNQAESYYLREEQKLRDHLMSLRHMRERYNLQSVQNERMYQYERMMLVAEGDVLAIEDLDARYALEQQAREENQQQREREEREGFREAERQRRETYEQQIDQMRQAYEDQLLELKLRMEEQQLEAEIQRQEALRQEERDLQRRIDNQEQAHEDEMRAWNEHWAKIAIQTDLGANEITEILNSYFGPGGETTEIVKQFTARYREMMNVMEQVERLKQRLSTGRSGAGLTRWTPPPIGASEEILGYWQYAGGYQFGGEGFVSKPTMVPMGESGPERFSVRPMGPSPSMVLRWAGGPIPVQGTGDLSGMNLGGIGDAIVRGLIIEMRDQLTGRRI